MKGHVLDRVLSRVKEEESGGECGRERVACRSRVAARAPIEHLPDSAIENFGLLTISFILYSSSQARFTPHQKYSKRLYDTNQPGRAPGPSTMIEGTTLSVHRCRFVDYTPSAVTALAFPPLPLPSVKGKNSVVRKALKFGTLAVGRANGNIELCEWSGSEHELQAPQAWVVRKVR